MTGLPLLPNLVEARLPRRWGPHRRPGEPLANDSAQDKLINTLGTPHDSSISLGGEGSRKKDRTSHHRTWADELSAKRCEVLVYVAEACAAPADQCDEHEAGRPREVKARSGQRAGVGNTDAGIPDRR